MPSLPYHFHRPVVLSMLASTLLFVACGENRSSTADMHATGLVDRQAVETLRGAKDSALRTSSSPIPASIRGGFPGLRYFAPTGDYVFNLELDRLPKPEPVKIAATQGDVRNALRIGYFRFVVDGVSCALAAYELEGAQDELFVPFNDATNGKETYEGGRYVDLPAAGPRYRLDFNYAYNPFCAYNHAYTCPRVPSENVLPVAIRAGEMVPPTGFASDH